MKKIFYIVMIAFVSVLLVACDKGRTFDIKIDSCNGVRNAVVVNYTITDPEQELKGSSINAELYKAGEKTPVSTQEIKYDVTKLTGEVRFSGLDGGVEYTVKIAASYEGKQIYLSEMNVSTTVVGNEVEKPYEIKEAAEFTTLLKNDPTGHFKLVADIDFAGTSIAPLFTNSTAFNGTFDGNGHKVSNFKVGEPNALSTVVNKYYGLFGYIGSKGVIKNVTFDSFVLNITRGSTVFAGLIAGYNEGKITDVKVTNSSLYFDITTSSHSNNSDSSGTLSGYYVGGLVGHNRNGALIENCTVDLDMTVKARRHAIVGGIAAINFDNTRTEQDSVINACTYTGTIDLSVKNDSTSAYESTTCLGGIIGRNYSVVSNCTTTGAIILNSEFKTPSTQTYLVFAGGLVGWNNGQAAKVEKSSSSMTSNVVAKQAMKVYAGLLVGRNGGDAEKAKAKIINCTYELPAGASCQVEAYVGNYYTGLVGLDRNPNETTCTSKTSFNIFVRVYEKVKGENDVETLTLKEDITVEVK